MNKGRKITGGKYHSNRKKKFYEIKRTEREITIGDPKRKDKKLRGGTIKKVLLNDNSVNVVTEKGIKKATIKNVLKTPQNKFLARKNRLMKGVILETELGKAKITNRPTKDNLINAVLIKE
jgi:small subunit ribosomal protein S8e